MIFYAEYTKKENGIKINKVTQVFESLQILIDYMASIKIKRYRIRCQ